MRKILLIVVVIFGFSIENGHSLAVIDSSNLAQNIITAKEALVHTQNQLQQIQNQLNQYKRMVLDATNPSNWNWGNVQDTLNQRHIRFSA